MADVKENILISIEIEKGDGEKQIDNLTRKITDLQTATANLQKQNNDLIKQGKQNSEEYIENTRQIEINKQKINESIASRKGLIQTLTAEDNSIKALNVRNAELKKQRDLINTSTEEGRAKISQINAEIDKNNQSIIENSSHLEKQKFNIGNYASAIDGLIPGMGMLIGLFTGAGKAVAQLTKQALAFIATPIGLVIAAVGAALFALQSYFKGSEEGQNRLNKIMAVGSAIFEQFMNIVEDLGEALFDAFTNPKQAAIDFGNFIKENLINRFEGLLELIPALAKSVDSLLSGEFTKAGKIATDAVLKVTLGVENATDKLAGFIETTTELVNKGIENGQRLAEFQARIDKEARALVVEREKTNLEVAKLRADALEVEGEARKKVLQEAIALEEQLASRETSLAKTRLANAELIRDANGDDKEALDAVAQARADVFAAEAKQFSDTLRFRKEIAAIDEASAKEQAKLLEEANQMLDDAEKLELERQARIQEALKATEQLRLEQAVVNADSLEERIEREIELETFKTFSLLENETLLAEERQAIIEKSQATINGIIVKGTAERVKKEKEEEEKLAKVKEKLRNDNIRGIEASADAAISFAEEAFGQSKGLAVAQATINTIMGVTRALSDYIFPYSLIVGALTAAAGAVQINKILSTKAARGMLVKKFFGRGGVSRNGWFAQGPSHAQGGIPGFVRGSGPIEFEGGEVIINKKSSRMFRPLLSQINQAGGGVAFGRGGVTRYQTGGISGSQTRQASSVAESRTAIRDAVLLAMENMPPTIVTVEDINERQTEVADQSNKAIVL